MLDIALVTYAASPDLTPDDRLLDEALRARGARTHVVPWDAPADWRRFDRVMLRSPWDYYIRAGEFQRWLSSLDRLGVTLVNPYPVLRWNGDKRYLIELEQRGVRIVPTELVGSEHGDTRTLGDILIERGWDEAVVKPVVSAAAHETWRTSLAAAPADQTRFRVLRANAEGGVFVQPFMPEVIEEGEWSLIFIAGRFSHAAIKRPRAGDFRVQHVFGGAYAPASASPAVIADAGRVVAAGAACAGVDIGDLAYARVDGIVRTEYGTPALVLMELECLEPSLFFLQEPAAADRMAATLLQPALASDSGASYLR